MGRDELIRELETCRHELEAIGKRLGRLEERRASLAAKLQVPAAKLARDIIGAGAGIALAPPTFGLSLLVAFWSSCSLVVDGLDISSDVVELYAAAIDARQLRRRQASIMLRMNELERILRGDG